VQSSPRVPEDARSVLERGQWGCHKVLLSPLWSHVQLSDVPFFVGPRMAPPDADEAVGSETTTGRVRTVRPSSTKSHVRTACVARRQQCGFGCACKGQVPCARLPAPSPSSSGVPKQDSSGWFGRRSGSPRPAYDIGRFRGRAATSSTAGSDPFLRSVTPAQADLRDATSRSGCLHPMVCDEGGNFSPGPVISVAVRNAVC
jgi:hypothetical protein